MSVEENRQAYIKLKADNRRITANQALQSAKDTYYDYYMQLPSGLERIKAFDTYRKICIVQEQAR